MPDRRVVLDGPGIEARRLFIADASDLLVSSGVNADLRHETQHQITRT